MKKIKFFVIISCFSSSSITLAKNQDVAFNDIAPKSAEIPDPPLKKEVAPSIKNKSLTTLEMSEHLSLQPRLEYDNYFNIKPTKPQTLGFNLFWDI